MDNSFNFCLPDGMDVEDLPLDQCFAFDVGDDTNYLETETSTPTPCDVKFGADYETAAWYQSQADSYQEWADWYGS
jgi:hypothetical protein